MNDQIIGLGAQSPVGRTALTTAAAVRAGISRVGFHPRMAGSSSLGVKVGMATFLPDDSPPADRMAALASGAAMEALFPLRALGLKRRCLRLFCGIPAARPGLPDDLGRRMDDEMVRTLAREGLEAEVEIIAAGHSAGLMAVDRALHSEEGMVLAGGVDSYLSGETLAWLDKSERLHSPAQPWGMMPGEGAGFCLLAGKSAAQQAQATPIGQVVATATAIEKNLARTGGVCIGEGLSAAWRQALGQVGVKAKVAETVCDLNGDPYRADEFGFSLARLGEFFENSARFVTPAGNWGDVGAASGPLFLALAAVAGLKVRTGECLRLLSTSSESGERCAALVDSPQHCQGECRNP